MRSLRVVEFLSLDGVMQSPGAPDEDTEGGFRHGGWQPPYFDDVLVRTAGEGMASTGAYLFGRKTYEKMASYWPRVGGDDPFARHLNATPKHVASRTLDAVEWQGTHLLEGDAAEAVRALKTDLGGSITVLGSGDLVQTLIAHDLVDEYFLVVFPLLLGGGKRLFRDDGQLRRLRLVSSQETSTGGLMLTYRPD
jgi:dihydrofolate reductase